MPIDYFNYYTMLEPFANDYYKVKETAKARDLLSKLIKKYQENLTYYNSLKSNQQNDLYIDIISDIERYRALLEVMKNNGDTGFYSTNKVTFNSYNRIFERFGRDDE